MTNLQPTQGEQPPLECADWQIVDNRYMVFINEEYHNDGLHYYVADLVEHSIANLSGPAAHGKEKVDLDDPEQICILCSSCHDTHGCWDPCSAYRKPKAGVSEESLKELLKNANNEQAYYDNTVPDICPHAQALVTVLKRKEDLQVQNNTAELEKEYVGKWIFIFDTIPGNFKE